MADLNLFGEMQDDPPSYVHKGKYQIFRVTNHYRLAESKSERCKNCVNLIGVSGNTKNYYKCKLMGTSMSEASDIRLNHVCEQFKRESK